MTVQELIEKLKKMPPYALVGYYDAENGWQNVEVSYTNKIVQPMTGKTVYVACVDLTGEW